MQEVLDKFHSRSKLVPDMLDKLSKNQPMTPHIKKIAKLVQLTYHLLKMLGISHPQKSEGGLKDVYKTIEEEKNLQEYYIIMKQAIKQGYSRNAGLLSLMAMKQWGYQLDQ